MRAYTWTDPKTGFEIHVNHNGDMSGDAIVLIPEEMVNITWPDQGVMGIKLPAKMLADFSRTATVRDAIGYLEDLLDEG